MLDLGCEEGTQLIAHIPETDCTDFLEQRIGRSELVLNEPFRGIRRGGQQVKGLAPGQNHCTVREVQGYMLV